MRSLQKFSIHKWLILTALTLLAAVLSGGNSPKPMGVRAPLKEIAQAAREAGISAPAIILVGPVAELDLTVDFSQDHTV